MFLSSGTGICAAFIWNRVYIFRHVLFYSRGMHSIVLGDFIKHCVMTIACVSVAIIAAMRLHGNGETITVPDGWYTPFWLAARRS